MKCKKCGYEWKTKSTHRFVSCPSCLGKVKNLMDMEEFKIIYDDNKEEVFIAYNKSDAEVQFSKKHKDSKIISIKEVDSNE